MLVAVARFFIAIAALAVSPSPVSVPLLLVAPSLSRLVWLGPGLAKQTEKVVEAASDSSESPPGEERRLLPKRQHAQP